MDDNASVGTPPSGLISSSLWRTAARAASSVLLATTVIGLARIAPARDFGIFLVSGSAATILGLLLTLGASSRILQAGAETDPGDRARSLFQLQALTGITVLAGAGAAAMIADLPTTVLAGVAWGLGDVLQIYAQNHFSGRRAHGTTNLLILSQRLLPAVVVLAALASGQDISFVLLAWIYALVAVVAALAPWPGVRQHRFSLSLATAGSVPWWGLSLAPTLVLLQAPVVALTADASTAGLFGLAARVVGPVLLIPTAIATVTVPALAAHRGSPEIWVRHRRFAQFCLLYAAAVVLAAWPAALVICRLADLSTTEAQLLVAGTILGASLSAYAQSSAALFAALGRPSWATRGIVAGGTTGLVLLAVLGGAGQVASLGLAVVTTEVVVLAVFGVGVRRLRQETAAG